MNIPSALQSLSTAGSALKELANWLNKSKGDSRRLITELKNNLTYIDLVLKDDLPLEDFIDKISSHEYDSIAGQGFNFNRLKEKKIASYPSLKGSDLATWQGKKTEDLIHSIYDKIREVKLRYPHVKDSKNYRWAQRLHNIRKKIWLLLRHIK